MREGRLWRCVVTGTSLCFFTRPTVWGCIDVLQDGKAQRTRRTSFCAAPDGYFALLFYPSCRLPQDSPEGGKFNGNR